MSELGEPRIQISCLATLRISSDGPAMKYSIALSVAHWKGLKEIVARNRRKIPLRTQSTRLAGISR